MRIVPPSAILPAVLAASLSAAACGEPPREAPPHGVGLSPATRPADTLRPPQVHPESILPGRPWSTAARYVSTLRFAGDSPASATRAIRAFEGCRPSHVTLSPERRAHHLRRDDFRGTVRVLARAAADRPPPGCAGPFTASLGLARDDGMSYLLADGAGGAYWVFRDDSAIGFSRRWSLAITDEGASGRAPAAGWFVPSVVADAPRAERVAAWIVCGEGRCTATSPGGGEEGHQP